jgi:hypothetical protein
MLQNTDDGSAFFGTIIISIDAVTPGVNVFEEKCIKSRLGTKVSNDDEQSIGEPDLE